jgi:3-isopropylmalate/(R)-2-methylmalate dehydratase large subunit
MGMTITEYILAHASGQETVKPGDTIRVHADILLMHDVCGPEAIGIFKQNSGADARVFRRDGIVIIPGHGSPERRGLEVLREFVQEQDLPYFYDPGTTDYIGTCHEAFPKRGHCRPGEIVFGTDPRTCMHGAFGLFAACVSNAEAAEIMATGFHRMTVPQSVRVEVDGLPAVERGGLEKLVERLRTDLPGGCNGCALEFCGPAVEQLKVEDRKKLCTVAADAGAVNAIVALDQKTLEYVKARSNKPFTCFFSDSDAIYKETRSYRADDFR